MGRSGRRRVEHHRAEVLLRHEVFLLSQKARAALRRGKLREAEAGFRRVIGIEPSNRQATIGLGEVHLRRGEYAAAVEVLERALGCGPPGEHVLYLLATACRGAQRREKAFKYYLELVELNPSHLKALTRLGEAYLERKDFARAREVFLQALDLDPHNVYALRGLAFAHRGKRDYQEAIPVYEQLLRLTPRDHRVLVRLGEAYAHEGDAANARRAYRLALEVEPRNQYALDGLSRLG